MAISHGPISGAPISAVLQQAAADVPDLPGWIPTYPVFVLGLPVSPLAFAARPVHYTDLVPDLSTWIGEQPVRLNPIPRLTTAAQLAFSINIDPIPTPAAPDLSWQHSFPDRLPRLQLLEYPAWFAPQDLSDPTPDAAIVRQASPDFTTQVREASTASYFGLLVDEFEQPISAGVLSTLVLQLYVIDADNDITILRNHSVLNQNQVTFYGAAQTRASGQRYNLRWVIQPSDTTLVDPSLAFERHIALFTYTWIRPGGGIGIGRREIVLNVQNLGEV
jgi:hypothetical protein